MTPGGGARRAWRLRPARLPRSAHTVASVLAALLVAIVASACGQYYGVHERASQRNRVELSSSHNKATESPPPYAGDDGAQGPGPGAITGDAALVVKREIVGAGPKERGGASKRGASPTPDRSSRPTTGSSRPKGNGAKRSPGSPTNSIPKSVQEVLRAGANYNSRFLPQGFPFVICPVQGRYSYSDDYGAPRYAGGYHPHAGNDIFAGQGTPIVAPFSGYVEKDPNTLGGNAVQVTGSLGYVYMAHLVAYAPSVPGPVEAGDVVGFVGNTGDALGTSYHDHFEWHPKTIQAYDKVIPGTNGAVDPYLYLRVVCPPG
jgi:murein DD-endopeptidase MepM/ murein hydrolase activator NlpD